MKLQTLLFIVALLVSTLASAHHEGSVVEINLQENEVENFLDRVQQEQEEAQINSLKRRGLYAFPLKVGAQIENNLVNHSALHLAFGADINFAIDDFAAGIGCDFTYSVAISGTEEGRALNEDREDKICFVQVMLLDNYGSEFGFRYGKGKTQVKGNSGFEADNFKAGFFLRHEGIEAEVSYFRLEIPKELQDEAEINGTFALRVVKPFGFPK